MNVCPKMKDRVIFKYKHMVIKKYKHGYLLFNSFDRIIGKSIDLYGEWCDEELKLLDKYLNEGDAIIDAGANIGTHTVFFAKKVKEKGRVYAFEPQRILFQNLCANVSLNWLTNVECCNMALGKTSRQIIVPYLNYLQRKNFGGLRLGTFREGEKIRLEAIDNFKLEKCNLIKIDVEGMEAEVLKGASKTISKHKPILFVENNTEKYSRNIIKYVHKLSYKAYWHIRPYYNKNNYYKNKNELFKKYGNEINMICFSKNSRFSCNLPRVEGVNDTGVNAMKRMKIHQ